LLTILIVAAGCGGSSSSSSPASPPNIVIIQTDDQIAGTVTPELMPNTVDLLADSGTSFSHYIVTTPQCCPSRSSLNTGQYGHNNGVLSNGPGYPDLRDKDNTLAVWLRRAGYATAQIGKYINGYDKVVPATKPAPGFDRWALLAEDNRYYDWHLAIRGHVVKYGSGTHNYVTSVLGDLAVKWIRRDAAGPKPFFLELNEHAPHADPGVHPCTHSAVPARRDLGELDSIQLPDTRSLDEANVSDKPSFIRRLPPVADRLDRLEKHYRCALASLREVDRNVRDVYEAVERAGELDRTVFIFTSDNGYLYGQHRIAGGKVIPYEEALRQPLILDIPDQYRGGEPAVRESSAPVANIDIAPTIVELAGACSSRRDDCRVMDGRSLVGLTGGDTSSFDSRALAIEFGDSKHGNNGICAYQGVHTSIEVYVEYRSVVDPRSGQCVPGHETELYSLDTDSYELDNELPAPPDSGAVADAKRLRALTRQLQECAGIRGRDPAAPSGNYCQ